MKAAEDIKLIIYDTKPQLPTPDASPVSIKLASPRPTRVFLPPPRIFASSSSNAVPTSSQIQSHIAFALACGRATKLAALRRAMVTSALDARHERERELLRLVETAGNHTTIHGEDKKVVESEGKREETPREQLDIVARLNAPATITGVPSTDSTTGFVYKRRTFTLLLTEHTSRRPAPYVVPAPRSVSKTASSTSSELVNTPPTSSMSRQNSSFTIRRRLSLPTCLLSLAARSQISSKPTLQTPKSRPSIINTPWTNSLNEQRRAAFTLSAMAVGGLGVIEEDASEGMEQNLRSDEDARLCGRRGKVVRPLRLL